MPAHLGSLEETVLTLAEALPRPQERQVPTPREGDRSWPPGHRAMTVTARARRS